MGGGVSGTGLPKTGSLRLGAETDAGLLLAGSDATSEVAAAGWAGGEVLGAVATGATAAGTRLGAMDDGFMRRSRDSGTNRGLRGRRDWDSDARNGWEKPNIFDSLHVETKISSVRLLAGAVPTRGSGSRGSGSTNSIRQTLSK